MQIELDKIKEHDLRADVGITDHDAIIMAQATKLLKIGYLEYEIAAYGTAYCKNNDIYYFISEREDTMGKFMHDCAINHIFPSPIKYFFKRYDLIDDTVEHVKSLFRIEIARKLQTAYPPIFFDAMADLTASVSENASYPFLKEMTEQLDSCFDSNQLKLFGKLLEMMLCGRQLSYERYLLLNQWLNKEYEKIAVEPMVSGGCRRTFSGFAYKKPDGEIKYFCDAYPYLASEKQILFINKGFLVTPCLTTTYYANAFSALENAQNEFRDDLKQYLGTQYIRLMALLRLLPPAIDEKKYAIYQEKIAAANSKQAMDAFCYYGYLWNVK